MKRITADRSAAPSSAVTAPVSPSLADLPSSGVRSWVTLVICLVMASITINNMWLWNERMQHPIGSGMLAVLMVIELAAPCLTLLLALETSWRFPFVRGGRRRAIVAHLAVASLVAVFFETSESLFDAFGGLDLVNVDPPLWGRILGDFFLYALLLGFALFRRYVLRYRALELARVALGTQLADAQRQRAETELSALKAELSPHFLTNALASVSALLRTDVHAAQQALGQLGVLLGRLRARAEHEVTLGDELDGLEPILEYERLRLGGRLIVRCDVAADVRAALVPDLVLQPLIENAVKHGLAPRGGGELVIDAARTGERGELLVVRVCDRGAERSAVKAPHGGVGIANVRSRLRDLYGEVGRIELRIDDEQTVAELTIPWRDDGDVALEPLSATEHAEADAPYQTRGGAPHRSRYGAVPWQLARVAGAVALWALHAAFRLWGAAHRMPMPGNATDPLALTSQALVTASIEMTAFFTFVFLVLRSTPRLRFGDRAAGVHVAALVGFALVDAAEKTVWARQFEPATQHVYVATGLGWLVANRILTFAAWYLVAVGAVKAVTALRLTRDSRVRQLQLQRTLATTRQRKAEAELRRLRLELNPHYVGNALHVISSLTSSDPAAAARMLEELSVLLRDALRDGASSEVTLREELRTLEPFIELEKARLGRPLELSWQIDDAVLDGRVPHMILQPLLENAVRHGLARRSDARRVHVEARRMDRELELIVRDDGAGLDDGGILGRTDVRQGTGLANARARLTELYGPRARLELTSGAAHGTIARVRIPWRSDGREDQDRVAWGMAASVRLPIQSEPIPYRI